MPMGYSNCEPDPLAGHHGHFPARRVRVPTLLRNTVASPRPFVAFFVATSSIRRLPATLAPVDTANRLHRVGHRRRGWP
jgi:hypothetical protein